MNEVQQADDNEKPAKTAAAAAAAAAVDLELEGRAYLTQLLHNGCKEGDSGAPLELPTWYDEAIFKRAQDYFSKYRFLMISGMFTGLLSVLAIPSILKVLICTRQSAEPVTAYRRYVRTLLHTLAWYENRVTADKRGRFWTSIRTVRRAHTRSSRACAKLAAGTITQKDLAITQFGFMGYMTLGASRIQLHDDDYLECTTHMWRVLGYLLGIKDEYNLCADSWAATKPRLTLVMREIYTPALENTDAEFERMARTLVDGFWALNGSISYDVEIYFTKRLAHCRGYEYYDYDYAPGVKRDRTQKLRYYDLRWYDRIFVAYALFIVTYLHKYALVRWYLNFRVWLSHKISYVFPYLAIFMFGVKHAYVRIFNNNNEANELELHLKDD